MAKSNSHKQDTGHDDRPVEIPIVKRKPTTYGRRGEDSNVNTPTPTRPTDPRFNPKCAGSSDTRHFVRNYSFLSDLRQQEIEQLQKALRREKESEKQAKIKLTINRLKNKMVESNNKSKKLDLIGELKAGKGSKFKNVKKSEIKKNLLVNKFKELKETGKLSRYLERKRKKLINRDGKGFA